MNKIVKWLVLIGGILTVVCVSAPTLGQRSDGVRMTPQLALATLTWSEAGLVTRTVSEDGVVTWSDDGDMRGIHAVLLRGAERTDTSYLRFAAMYARRLIGREGGINREWLWDLRPDGREPARWPTTVRVQRGDTVEIRPHAQWGAFRDRWLNTYERAGEVVQLGLDTWADWGVCSEPPDDWGGDMDHARATRIGLIQLECDERLDNRFYLRPSSISMRD